MNEPNHNERPHAERSASQLGSLVLCPGYRPKPTKRVHWVTAQGTRGHEALDKGEEADLESGFEERMVKLCQEYSDSLPLHTREFQEQRFDTMEGRWGFTDRLRIRAKAHTEGSVVQEFRLYDSDEADLLDWKFVKSKIVVDAEINLQGKDYVVGIFEDPQFAFLNKIHVHFVMPRFASVTTATYTRADLPRLKLEIYAVLCASRDTDRGDYDGASLTPNYETCKYCGAAGNCVALRKIAYALRKQYDPSGYGDVVVPTETHAQRVKDPAQRAQLQKLAGLMEEWAKSVRAHNLSTALEDDKHLPEGYEIDWSKGRRYVTDTEKFEEAAREFGLTTADVINSSHISWGRLEEVLRERQPKGKKKDAVERFERRLVELGAIERPEPTPKLKPAVHTS
jgi:hypothetical protein